VAGSSTQMPETKRHSFLSVFPMFVPSLSW
jgi:hypothetical protein